MELKEINEVILTYEHHTIWKLGMPVVAGARSQRINGIAQYAGGVAGERDTAQLGALLQLSIKPMLLLPSFPSLFFGFQY